MSEFSSINTLIGTFSSIDDINRRTTDTSNLICIDTSYNRIGIHTIDPSYSIHIRNNNNNNSNGIYTPRLFFDLTSLLSRSPPTTTTISGEVYCDNSGFLRVTL